MFGPISYLTGLDWLKAIGMHCLVIYLTNDLYRHFTNNRRGIIVCQFCYICHRIGTKKKQANHRQSFMVALFDRVGMIASIEAVRFALHWTSSTLQ